MTTAPRFTTTLRDKLPTRLTRATRALAWATLISNIGIILTGGAVRLTASGLGCPEWPRCTADSWVATQEMGMHGAIEFGNRLLTYVLVAICAAMFFSVVRLWNTHRPLVVMSIVILAGIPLQAVIGGITVWTNLNPWVVSLHFLVSAGLVMVATMLLNRVSLELRAPGQLDAPLVDGARDGVTSGLAPIILAASWVAVVLGTVVTGTGPHAGDPGSPRHGFDPDLVTRMHVVPVYILCAAAVVLIIRQLRLQTSPAQRRAAWLLVAVILGQGAIGYWQHFTGLPILLVWFHMLGSALLMVAATMVFDRYRAKYRTRGLGDPAEPETLDAAPTAR
ncbi:COX15/CtaA family protein [Nesterenkonia massiliensis]|uniref:COX15/CtaA family protein n=1 Tax=Nesterenkonia massiliensis TaxID=1232429 RepID=UPI0003FD9A9B|nr:COX15/CtaA family protein [Nesterenkonia massiliensis]